MTRPDSVVSLCPKSTSSDSVDSLCPKSPSSNVLHVPKSRRNISSGSLCSESWQLSSAQCAGARELDISFIEARRLDVVLCNPLLFDRHKNPRAVVQHVCRAVFEAQGGCAFVVACAKDLQKLEEERRVFFPPSDQNRSYP